MSGDGDGWVQCAAGHRHWGRFGAAGLLISDGHRVILQHRAPWTHEGDTWALPGGARDSHEDPTSTALREAREEAAIAMPWVEPLAMRIDDHGGWSYTTVLGRSVTAIAPHAANAESTDVRWWPTAEIDGLPLHHGFAATWPHVRTPPPQLRLIIDVRTDPRLPAMADAGSTDRRRLEQLARHGVPVDDLPTPLAAASMSVLLPRVTVVDRSAAPPLSPAEPAADGDWWPRAVRVISPAAVSSETAGGGSPDTAASVHQTVVITRDEGLIEAVHASGGRTTTARPQWLVDLLDRRATG